MTLQPLTPAGVSAKMAEVYGLSTHDRIAEAAAVENNWKAWIGDNFSLTTAQATFLSGISGTANTNYGYNCGLCFRNLLEISLVTPTPPDQSTKWLKLTNNLLVATNAAGSLEVTGSLTFAFEYR